LARLTGVSLEPRKSPMQSRSVASVDAILAATIQVLLRVGKERLTTTRVAARAGVSIGTLYQYFPNKSSLLGAVLRRHMDDVASAIECTCREQAGRTLEQMRAALINAFLAAKMRDVRISVALYAVSADLDGVKIAQKVGVRSQKAIACMLETTTDPLTRDPQLIAAMLQGTMAGVSRRLVESAAPEKQFDSWREELIFLCCSYLQACTAGR
jgi:AcrR family transcriptional regulator